MNNIAYFCALEEIDEFDAKRYAKQVLDFAPDNPAFTDTFAYVKYRFSLPRLDIGRKAKIEELKEALDLFEKAKKLALEQGSDWELTYKNADLHSSQASIAIERIEKR
jgi:hypothetical protein